MRSRRWVAAQVVVVIAATAALLSPPALAATGDLTTFAGSLGEGLATRVAQDSPGLAISGRTLFVGANRPQFEDGALVRAVNLDTGQERVVAGNGLGPSSGDGGPATAAGLRHVGDLAVGPGGVLYVLDDYAGLVRRIDAGGTITTVAGGGSSTADGVRATDAYLSGSKAIAVDASGRLLVAGPDRVRRIGATGVISTIAGNPAGSLDDGIPALSARLQAPADLAFDPAGNLYLVDGPRVRRVDQGGIIRTVAGGGADPFGADGAVATEVKLVAKGLAFDPQGALLIADARRILRLDVEGRLHTAAGNGQEVFLQNGTLAAPSDGSPATEVPLAAHALVTDPAGTIYTAELGRRLVRRIDPSGVITTLAGNGTARLGGDGGPALQAQLWFPTAIEFDQSGTAYVADTQNRRVRVISTAGTISSLPEAIEPGLLAVDGTGRLFVASTTTVSRRDTGGTVTVVAGGGITPPVEGGQAAGTKLDIVDIATDAVGTLYIADRARIRKVDAEGVMTTVAGGGPATPSDGLPVSW